MKQNSFYSYKKYITITAIAAVLLTAAFGLCGCKNPVSETGSDPLSATAFKLNTVVKITLYDSQDQTVLDHCLELCDEYEKIFSRTRTDSELYKLNHRELSPVPGTENTYKISDDLAELLSTGLSYSAQSQGAFQIAIAPLTDLWDFTAEDPVVPEEASIKEAAALCSSENIVLEGQEITLPDPNTAFDLGAVAKGYIADRLKEYLLSQNVQHAIIDLGGNVLCIGGKSESIPFHIGIQKPFADRSETIAVMDITDQSVVSSGVYERYFEQNGTLYHHILDPSTGYPYHNGLISVTVISDRSVDGDALSTVCFSLGLEKGLAYAQSQNVHAVFITEDYSVHYTEGFQDAIPIRES